MMTNVLLQASALPSKKTHFFLDTGEMHAAVIILAVVAGGRGIHAATARHGTSLFLHWQELCSDLQCWEVHYLILEFNS